MDTQTLTIRPARRSDLDALVSLLQVLFAIEADFVPDPGRQRRGLARLLDGGGRQGTILVATRADQVVAMATVQVMISTAQGGPVGLVEDVVVREDCRRRGVGRALMRAVAAWAVNHGLTRLQLLADRGNGPALEFYRRAGWQGTQLVCLRYRPPAG